MMRRRSAILLVWSLLGFALPARTQELKVTTRLVQVTVIVQDRKGQAIPDLTQADFELTDQGKPQIISVFTRESNRNLVGRTEPLPEDVYSNMPVQTGASENFTAILFDLLNTSINDQASARKEIVRFLQQIRPQDRVGIYGLSSTLQVIHDFTGDSESLARALARYARRLSPERESSIVTLEDNSRLADSPQEARFIAAMDNFLNDAAQRVANDMIEQRASRTLQALEAVSNHLVALPGRKNLVWISGGFPFSYGSDVMQLGRVVDRKKNFAENLRRTAQSITDANVAIYPVDARALIGTAGLKLSASAELPMTSARQAARADLQALEDLHAANDTMQELADQTGGRAVYNNNDVQGAIRVALEDARFTYTLGFYPTDANFDGKFRPIRVSVKRPGVQLRYRRGYYAFPAERPGDAQSQKIFGAAAVSPIESTGIGFAAELGAPAANDPRREVALDIDTRSIHLKQDQGHWIGEVEVLFAQFDTQGKLLTSGGRKIPLKLTDEDREQLLKNGFVMNAPLQIKAACDHLRIVLRDTTTGAIGTVTLPISRNGVRH
jgi:VWFA-related protein